LSSDDLTTEPSWTVVGEAQLARNEERTDTKVLSGTMRPRKVTTSLLSFFVIYAAALAVCLEISSPGHSPFNYYLTVVWTLYLPVGLMGLAGVLVSRVRRGPTIDLSSFEGQTDKKVVIVLPTLGKPGNLNALKRVIGSILEHGPRNLSDFRVDVVIDEGPDLEPLYSWLGETSLVRVVVVPSGYRTPLGAKYKTRANQYALEFRRSEGENTKDVMVYHLDDDTHVGRDTIASIAEFAELYSEEYYLAQGILTFPHQLSPSWFSRMADSIRPAGDIAQFTLFTGVLGTPMVGLHGEHLLVRGDIEEEIGWDFPETIVEDAYFALEFCKLHRGRARMLNSYSYGASPATVIDLVRQRRRWSEGLFRLVFERSLPWKTKLPLAYSVICWSLAPFQFVGLVWLTSQLLGIGNTSPIAQGFVTGWSMVFTVVLWQYLEGLKINLSVSGASRARYYCHAPLMLPLLYVFGIVEGLGGVLGLIRFCGVGRHKVFEVINKPL